MSIRTKRILAALMIVIGCVPISVLFIITGVWVFLSVTPLASAINKTTQVSFTGAGAVILAGFAAIVIGIQCIVAVIIFTRTLLKKKQYF